MEQQKREGKTMTAEKIIDSLRFTATEADEQKDLFTPSHVLYKCRIINPENNRRYTFDYQCNPSLPCNQSGTDTDFRKELRNTLR